jgi:hypothetical protein
MKVNICGHNYDYELVEGLWATREEWGRHNSTLLRIEIDSDLPESVKGETTLHELLEAIKFWQDLRLPHQILSQISAGLFSILNNNKILSNMIIGNIPFKEET